MSSDGAHRRAARRAINPPANHVLQEPFLDRDLPPRSALAADVNTAPAVQSACFSRREPLANYLERLDYVSSSVLRRFARSGASPSVLTPSPVPKEATIGDALHALLLEPERFGDHYFAAGTVGEPPPDSTGSDPAGRTWLSADTCASLEAMRNGILQYSRAPLSRWLADGEKELSIYWTDRSGGRWKGWPDCFSADVILELKTAQDPRISQFARSRRRYGYDLQAAHYVEAVAQLTGRQPRFVYVAVESVKPHTVWVYELSTDELSRARDALQALKDRFVDAFDPACTSLADAGASTRS